MPLKDVTHLPIEELMPLAELGVLRGWCYAAGTNYVDHPEWNGKAYPLEAGVLQHLHSAGYMRPQGADRCKLAVFAEIE